MQYIFQKRPRENSQILRNSKKIHIVKPNYVNSSNFYFPNQSLETISNSSAAFDLLINPRANSIETIKSTLELIRETIIYAQHKIRKLTLERSSSKPIISEEDAKEIYEE